MAEYLLRDLASFEDYKQCEGIQKEVWRFADLDVVPAAELLVVHRYGGVAVGAFAGERMVGFVCGLLARRDAKLFHHSHMLGVLAEHRGHRLGERLKWTQRERVRAQGLDWINWTYDPLQAPNAHLNVNRLGAVVRTYLENVYGESWSPLHGGIPTDRFEADWWIESPRVLRAERGGLPEPAGWRSLPFVNDVRVGPSGFLVCEEGARTELDAPELLVAIPPAITPIMAKDRPLAIDWRLKTRAIFRRLFERRYIVVGFHRAEDRGAYRLVRRGLDEILAG